MDFRAATNCHNINGIVEWQCGRDPESRLYTLSPPSPPPGALSMQFIKVQLECSRNQKLGSESDSDSRTRTLR